MKLALFAFFALCALCFGGAQSTDYENYEDIVAFYDDVKINARGNIFQGILDIVRAITNRIKNITKDIIAKIDNIISDAREKMESIATSVVQRLGKLVENIENKFIKIAETSKRTRICLDKYIPLIKSELKNAESSTAQCVKGSIIQAKNIVNDVYKYIDSVHDNLDAMNDMVNDCLEKNGNVIAVTKCVWKQISNFKSEIAEIIGNAKDLLVDSAKKVANVISDGNKCNFEIARSTEERISNYVKDLDKCVKDKSDVKFRSKLLFV